MKVASIGTGGICHRHLQVLSYEPDVEIVGHVTRTLEHAEDAARRWGGRAYTDVSHLLEHEQLDAAWICVPPNAHGRIEQSLIAREIPFFVEKPLDADCVTAQRIAEDVARARLIVGVGYHWRAMDTIPEVKRILAANPPHMIVGAWHDATPPPPWWRHEQESGGQMVEQTTHLIDLARHLAGGANVVAAGANRHERESFPDADVDDVSAALLRFTSGAIGVFSSTCLLARGAAIYVQFVCDDLLVTVTQNSVVYESGTERREVHRKADPIAAEDKAFLNAVRTGNGDSVFASYADAIQTHLLCCEVRRASVLKEMA